jgi:hypothetical protein
LSGNGLKDWKTDREPDDQRFFPPNVVIQVKALACELPSEKEIPLSRFSTSEIARESVSRGIVAKISGSTVWRWLHEDAIKPWQYRSWIFPRDPQFELKAGRVLDLYQGIWQGIHLKSNEFVLSADEKTSIQVRRRKHASLPPIPGKCMKVEHEYERGGSLTYFAAWDVHHAKIFGRCEAKSGIVSFNRLVDDVMQREPYCSAKRVFWIVDNGSSHRGQPSINRLESRWPNSVLVHLPVHASWLNQIEIYFSILQRKVLTPNDFVSRKALTETINNFQKRYEIAAKPFEWKFTRTDLSKMMAKLSQHSVVWPHAA